jgi:hypothetical protein
MKLQNDHSTQKAGVEEYNKRSRRVRKILAWCPEGICIWLDVLSLRVLTAWSFSGLSASNPYGGFHHLLLR